MKDESPVTLKHEKGRTCCLDLSKDSINITPMLDYNVQSLPIYNITYGYYKTGAKHYTQRSSSLQLFQVFLTHKGSGRFFIDKKEYTMREGSVAFMNLGIPHRYETQGDLWEYEWVNFWGYGLDAYYSTINPEGFAIYDLNGDQRIPSLMKEIYEGTLSVSLKNYLHMGFKIQQLLDELAQFVSGIQQRTSSNQYNLSAAIRYADENYMHPITVQDLADVASLSKYYFIRIFNRQMGITPYKYINSVRLTKAKQLLISTNMTVDEIGWSVGYEGAQNLIHAFKQATGTTPNQYRNIVREE